MKQRIIIFISLIIANFCFAQDTFADYKKQQEMEFGNFISVQDSSFIQYKEEIAKQWNEFLESTQKEWVSYGQDFKTRGRINFESGKVEIAASKSPNDTKKDIKKALENQIIAMIEEKDESGIEVLKDQLATFNKKTTKERKKIAKTIVKQTKNQNKKTASITIQKMLAQYLNQAQPKTAIQIQESAIKGVAEKLSAKVKDIKQKNVQKEIVKVINKIENKQASIQPKINKKNVKKIASSLAQNAIKKEITTASGKKKTIYVVELSLLPNHLQKRIENFKPIIEKFCKQYDVDVPVALAIIHTESYFNPKAYNRHGNAYGMMQIVPRYAGTTMNSYLYGKKGKPSSRQLFNAKTNLEMGIAYIRWLRDKKWNKVTNRTNQYCAIICSYNGGPGSVYKAMTGRMRKIGQKRWDKMMHDLSTMDTRKLIRKLQKDIPWDETKKYIKTVTVKMEDVYGYKF